MSNRDVVAKTHSHCVCDMCTVRATHYSSQHWAKHLYRVTIRPGFPGHVLFLSPCPGVRAAFPKYGFCPGFPCPSPRSIYFYYFSVLYTIKSSVNLTRAAGICCVFYSNLNTEQVRAPRSEVGGS